ncbi:MULTISPECIES: DUF6928 family protein [Gordonia]|uniref:DUF6928 family protein n=1 Tax=Gordonia TaxID=2053 RepID=UPI001F313D75|nr:MULTISPECIES: hypothetical protein [Gordonia]WFN93511.1 hypothetical protein P5P27_02780 [Gordonia sihwensis]
MRLGDSVLPNISALWLIACPDPAAELAGGVYIDPEKTADFIEKAFADTEITPIGTSDLAAAVDGADNRVFAAHFGRLAVLAGASLRTTDPDELTSYLEDLGVGQTWALVSLDPDTDTGCVARWQDGELQRAFVGTPTVIRTDVGLPYPFEGPFWAGDHPQAAAEHDPLALPFHPGELADAAHGAWFGFSFHGDTSSAVDPARIPVTVYRVGPDDGFDNVIESSVPLRADAPTEPHHAHAAPEGSTEETEPIQRIPAPVATPEPQSEQQPDSPPARTPGPISRYFGFRGRL